MTTTTLRIENIPDALQEQPRWLAWRFETRDDKETKVPMSPATRRLADVTDPDCWTDFADCLSSVNRQGGYFSGIGFALGDGWAGVDFDDCRDPETGELHPAALEMMDRLVISAVEAAYGFGFPEDAAAVLIVELDGIEAGMDARAEEITRIFEKFHAKDVRVARDEAERQLLWKSRKSAFGALGRLAPCFLTQDGVVPRTRLPDVLRKCYEVTEKYGIQIANVFHAGDGNIHPILLFRQEDPEQCELVLKASAEILRTCVEAGGSITGEHGVGVEKMAFMPLLFEPQDLELMRDIRAVFNPDELCNPGKILPSQDDERWGIHLHD